MLVLCLALSLAMLCAAFLVRGRWRAPSGFTIYRGRATQYVPMNQLLFWSLIAAAVMLAGTSMKLF